MDDFRVGSVPPPDPYGNRRTPDALGRRRQHHEHPPDPPPDEPEDTMDTDESDQATGPANLPVEDYYLPTDPEDVED